MYSHLGAGFYESGKLHAGFEQLMRRLAERNGWFAPVSSILDHIRDSQGDCNRDDERRLIERR
jgi:hypothetical protein